MMEIKTVRTYGHMHEIARFISENYSFCPQEIEIDYIFNLVEGEKVFFHTDTHEFEFLRRWGAYSVEVKELKVEKS